MTYSSPSRTARVRAAAASEPASGSVSAKAMSSFLRRDPGASGPSAPRCRRAGGQRAEALDRRGSGSSVAQARAICSIARHWVSRSAPIPPYASGNGSASTSCDARSWRMSSGNSPSGRSPRRGVRSARRRAGGRCPEGTPAPRSACTCLYLPRSNCSRARADGYAAESASNRSRWLVHEGSPRA